MSARAVNYWLVLREPRTVPERKGPFGPDRLPGFIREVMDARPAALLTVITIHEDCAPMVDDGLEWLTIRDRRSAARVRRHRIITDRAWAAALAKPRR